MKLPHVGDKVLYMGRGVGHFMQGKLLKIDKTETDPESVSVEICSPKGDSVTITIKKKRLPEILSF